MPGKTYQKLIDLVLETTEELQFRMKQPGGDLYEKLFRKDLEALQELSTSLQKHRSAFFKTLGITGNEAAETAPGAIGSSETSAPAATTAGADEEYEEDISGRITGEFTRLPKGGTIYNPAGDDVFVPEVMVRNLGIEHRDVVSASPLGVFQNSPLYEFTVVERNGLGGTDQRESVYGPIYRHGGDWFVYSEEEGAVITVNPKDVKTLNLKEGDLVEAAYPRGELSSARVAWKFDDSSYLEVKQESPRRNKEKKPGPILEVGDPILSGKVVLVIGGDLYKEAFRRNFTRRGAEFLWETGFQGGEGKNIESKIRRSNVVVIVTEMMSHRIPDVEAMCKKHGIPYVYSPSKGSTGAVRESQKILAGGRKVFHGN